MSTSDKHIVKVRKNIKKFFDDIRKQNLEFRNEYAIDSTSLPHIQQFAKETVRQARKTIIEQSKQGIILRDMTFKYVPEEPLEHNNQYLAQAQHAMDLIEELFSDDSDIMCVIDYQHQKIYFGWDLLYATSYSLLRQQGRV